MWDLEGKKISESVGGHRSSVIAVAFSRDEKHIASVGFDGKVRLWNLQVKPIGHPWRGDQEEVLSATFSQDGKHIATGDKDGKVRLWDLEGKKISEWVGHRSWVTSIAFSPKKDYIVSASEDGSMRLWNLEGQQIGESFIRKERVSSVAFSPNGEYIVSGSWDRVLRLWQGGSWQSWLKIGCDRLSNHPVLVEPITEEAEAAGNTCFKHGGWSQPKKAQFLVKQGRAKARNSGNFKVAIAKFKQALKLDPSLDLDPETEAKELASLAMVEKGRTLVAEGEVKGALAAYTEAQKLAPTIISAYSWGYLCWFGSLYGYPNEVLFACEKAVELDDKNGLYRDSRGLARALTGDNAGAIEDFQAFIEWTEDDESKVQRQSWIEVLSSGVNPITPSVIKSLRKK